ncbi:hypothetical protein MKEN_00629200 [Mycena kentingensis (nom. inval.)]|nr:hypothetical protein MKEN_00629200 [Mycena kentingensis (nom. inval.)]
MILRGVIDTIASKIAWADTAFLDAACNAGLVSALSIAIRAIQIDAAALTGPARDLAPLCMAWLSTAVFSSPRRLRYPLFVEAARAGFLAACVDYWESIEPDDTEGGANQPLRFVSPAAPWLARIQHRQHCGTLRRGILPDSYSFLRGIQHAEYAALKRTIVEHLIGFFNCHPDEPKPAPFLVFTPNPGATPCDVVVGYYTYLQQEDIRDTYAEDFARMRASGGRFQMHFVGQPRESMKTLIPMPFCSPGGHVLMRRIERLALAIPYTDPEGYAMDAEPYREHISAMLEDAAHYPETY